MTYIDSVFIWSAYTFRFHTKEFIDYAEKNINKYDKKYQEGISKMINISKEREDYLRIYCYDELYGSLETKCVISFFAFCVILLVYYYNSNMLFLVAGWLSMFYLFIHLLMRVNLGSFKTLLNKPTVHLFSRNIVALAFELGLIRG